MDRDMLITMGWRIEQWGIAGMDRDLATVAAAARIAGVRPVAAAVLADRTEPDVARIRAFGLVAAALQAPGTHRVAAA